jgi:L-asparaginase/Glu-tRNA(Gln) amidotransferase subunit D
MSKPRIHILALGGTIATRPDPSGAMQMGLGADDLVLAVPLLGKLAEVSRLALLTFLPIAASPVRLTPGG